MAELASLAKSRLNDTNLVSSEGIQMHGGIGMTDEYEIGFYIKRARVCEHTFGNSAFHRNRYGELLGYGVGSDLAKRHGRADARPFSFLASGSGEQCAAVNVNRGAGHEPVRDAQHDGGCYLPGLTNAANRDALAHLVERRLLVVTQRRKHPGVDDARCDDVDALRRGSMAMRGSVLRPRCQRS